MRLLLISALLSFVLTNCPSESSTELVEMTTSVNPEEAGVVNPPEGTYFNGREITVVTEALDDQWEFTGWSGDTTASDDSLTFQITRDMNLVANYEIPTDQQPTLTTSAQPSEGGSIDPSRGTFELGATVDVEAIAADGWEFTEWSGDTSATQNPLTFTMNKSYSLVANFNELPESFANTITVSDGINSKNVVFGMDASATSGYDSGIDQELPPRPPEGSFYRRFVIPDYGLKEDFRPIQEQQTIWELEFAPESGNTITLSWDFSNTAHVGSLILMDDPDNPSIEVDMKSSTSYEVTDQSINTLYIVSN